MINYPGVTFNKETIANEKMFVDLLKSAELVKNFFNGDYAMTSAWFTHKNPLLGNTAPLDLFYIGRGHKVLAFIKNALKENICDIKTGKKTF